MHKASGLVYKITTSAAKCHYIRKWLQFSETVLNKVLILESLPHFYMASLQTHINFNYILIYINNLWYNF